jgi:hypothetical protein
VAQAHARPDVPEEVWITMSTQERIDVTPKPAEFDAVPVPTEVTGAELVVTVLSMSALLLTVVLVADPALRAAGVLLVTGALAAYVARRVAADRRRRRILGPRTTTD